MRPSNQYDRNGEKDTDGEPRRRSRVRLWTTSGRTTLSVTHSVLATSAAVIEFGRQQAGVDRAAFVRGEVLSMNATPTDKADHKVSTTDRSDKRLVADGGQSEAGVEQLGEGIEGIRQYVPGRDVDISKADDQSVVARMDLEERQFEGGEIVSTHFFDKLLVKFHDEFGRDVDAVISVLENPDSDGPTLIALRPRDGNDSSAVVMAVKETEVIA